MPIAKIPLNSPKNSKVKNGSSVLLKEEEKTYYTETNSPNYYDSNFLLPIIKTIVKNGQGVEIYNETSEWDQFSGKSIPQFKKSWLGGVLKKEVVSYDDYGNVTEVKDGNGQSKTIEYDPQYNYAVPTKVSLNNNVLYNVTYDPLSLQITSNNADENNQIMNYEYDQSGCLLKYIKI